MCPILFFSFLVPLKGKTAPLSRGRLNRYKSYISYKSYTNFDGQKSQYSCVFREGGGDKISCLGGQNFLLGGTKFLAWGDKISVVNFHFCYFRGTKFRSLIFTFAILRGQNIVLELKNYRYN